MEDEKKNSIYTCVGNNGLFQWYEMNLTTGRCEFHPTMSENQKILKQHYCCGYAALGSSIFLVGGRPYNDATESIDDFPTNRVHYFNTQTSKWHRTPNMKCPRVFPAVIPFENKLYVFGCQEWWPSNSPWMEYYDPQDKQWHSESLNSNPPSKVLLFPSSATAIDHVGRRFLFWNTVYFSVYHVDNHSWEYTDYALRACPPTPGSLVATDIAIVGNFIYWYFCGDIYAYDLTWKNTNFLFPVSSLHPQVRPPTHYSLFKTLSPFLLPIDNKHLCLVWYGFDRTRDNQESTPRDHMLNFLTIPIDTPNRDDALKSIHSLDPSLTPSQFCAKGSSLYCCLAVQQLNDEASKQDLVGGDSKFQIPDSMDLLDDLSQTMILKNSISYLFSIGKVYEAAALIAEKEEAIVEDKYKIAKNEDAIVDDKYKIAKNDVEELSDKAKVKIFLKNLGLEEYFEIFERAHLDDLDYMMYLSDEKLKNLKIPSGDREKLLSALEKYYLIVSDPDYDGHFVADVLVEDLTGRKRKSDMLSQAHGDDDDEQTDMEE